MTVTDRDFLSLDDLTHGDLREILDQADHVKKKPDKYSNHLRGRQVLVILEKPSLRTRVSFEIAVTAMGGDAVVITGAEIGLDDRESIEDAARVLSRWADAIVMRTFGQDRLERLAQAASVPVINALSDYSHPCQGLSDLQTIRERKGRLEGVALAYIGDGNNVAHSLMFGGALAGMDVRVATPPDHSPFPQVVERATSLALERGGRVSVTDVVAEAATGADVLYTDVWTSMGKEDEAKARRDVFERYRIDQRAVDLASDDVIVMHCLPAHRGDEISADVIDGPRSIVWDQAENRLHAQKALLLWLLG
jgi:ornithine carbamoyltransferase